MQTYQTTYGIQNCNLADARGSLLSGTLLEQELEAALSTLTCGTELLHSGKILNQGKSLTHYSATTKTSVCYQHYFT